jgi:hypothetical protein
MNVDLNHPWMIVAAVLVAVLGVGRLVRVITYDDFPPAAAVRAWWVDLTRNRETGDMGKWGKLAICLWCFTPWMMAVCVAWGLLTHFGWAWWLFWGWLGLSYVTSMIIVRDEPGE